MIYCVYLSMLLLPPYLPKFVEHTTSLALACLWYTVADDTTAYLNLV
jgi:hypothetical protein